jgi:spoIIIJ-associated protein
MNATASTATEILDTLLGYLGIPATVQAEISEESGITLQILTTETAIITGPRGDVLNDWQLLVNRMLLARDPAAPKVRVDAGHHRLMEEEKFQEKIRQIAQKVSMTGKAFTLGPLNAYYRRLVHQELAGIPDLATKSESGTKRFKKIRITKTSARES